jgi:acyl carrier protein
MRDRVFEVVKAVIRELNDELGYDSLRDVTECTPIFGGNEGIDSLSLVTLIVSLECDIERVFGEFMELSDEKALSRCHSPYRTAGTLTDFIVRQLGQTVE